MPYAHIQGQGCPKCKTDKSKNTTKNIIKRAIEIHENKYDYSLVTYKDANTKMIILINLYTSRNY